MAANGASTLHGRAASTGRSRFARLTISRRSVFTQKGRHG
jgi:hypothetical protein